MSKSTKRDLLQVLRYLAKALGMNHQEVIAYLKRRRFVQERGVHAPVIITDDSWDLNSSIGSDYRRSVRLQLAEQQIRLAMSDIGFNMTDENFKETPERFVKYLAEFTEGIDSKKVNPSDVLKVGFTKPKNMDEMIVQQGIPFNGVCAHHLLPMFGKATIGYIPRKRVVGLSKLARLVRVVGHQKPSLQEHITNEIAEAIEKALKPLGTMVVINAEHMCMACRGITAADVLTNTSAIRGRFVRDAVRQEFFALCNMNSKG